MAERGRKFWSRNSGSKPSRENCGLRHPHGLRGKQIGLWYAKRQKKKSFDPPPRSVVSIPREQEEKLAKLLQTIGRIPFSSTVVNELPSASLTESIEENRAHTGSENLTLDSTSIEYSGKITFETRYNQFEYDSKLLNAENIKLNDCQIEELKRIPYLDAQLYQEFIKNGENNTTYLRMQEFRRKLPSYASKDEIVKAIEDNPVVVISGETGCGKTTQLPQYILDSYIKSGKGSLCKVVCTQPRRISAITVAERVAVERAENCGIGSVGYQIRLENKLPRDQGSILYCTSGILLKWLESDAHLSRASHIIIDEVHERDLLTDFLIIIVKRILKQRSNLRVILMSASLNANQFSEYFDNCPILNISGFTYPVEELFLEDVLEMIGYVEPSYKQKKRINYKVKGHELTEYEKCVDSFLRNLNLDKYSHHVVDYLRTVDDTNIDVDLVVRLIQHLCMHKPEGAVLVFLPGWDVISKVNNHLNSMTYFQSNNHSIIPLHSLMPTLNQREVFEKPARGIRKIILATNIAETSITIEDVVYVIDCGKIKLKRFDIQNEISTLQAEWISRANAQQRRGRAGRVQSGVCYHLYTSLRHNFLEKFQLPEMIRTRLEELCLQVKLLKLGKIVPFLTEAMNSPCLDAVTLSIEFLQNLNALDSEENLTPLGFHLANLPVDPQAGKMILLGAIFGCLDPITTIAASLSYKDAFMIPMGKEIEADEQKRRLAARSKSDHLMLVYAFQGWENALRHGSDKKYCWENFLSRHTLQLLSNMKDQFLQLLREFGFVDVNNIKSPVINQHKDNEKLILAMVCAGLYPNVACVKKPNRNPNVRRPVRVSVCTKQEKSACLHRKSVNESETTFQSPWLVFHQKMKSSNVLLHDTSMIPPIPLLLFGGKLKITAVDDQPGIVVDDWIKVLCSPDKARLILNLKLELDRLLEHKILHPSPTNWDIRSREGAILHGIIDLISCEKLVITETAHRDMPDYVSDEDS